MADRKMDWWRAACRLDSVGAERQTGEGHSRRYDSVSQLFLTDWKHQQSVGGATAATWTDGHLELLFFLFHKEEFAGLGQSGGGAKGQTA